MVVKQKQLFSCIECGHSQIKWAGQCGQCSQWNTLKEEIQVQEAKPRFAGKKSVETSRPVKLREVVFGETPRMKIGLKEVDRLLGGGLVPGSLSLIGGDPGVGKSTLMLQLANALANQGMTVLYVCGEESTEQTSLRAQRLDIHSDHLYLLNETNFTAIQAHVEQVKPDIMVVDSIQIVYKPDLPSSPGSVTQVRETATEFLHIAKGQNIAIFLIGHVTKAGEIAGPRVLEHLVDTVLYFEGDRQHHYRMIRVVKNRFGPTDEVAIFQMQSKGLVEVENPSLVFLEERRQSVVGSAIIPVLEGSRAVLIEAQALVTETFFPTPSRRCAGMDTTRLALLLAVLEKRMGYQLHRCDIFVSIAGGMRIGETGLDLGALLAVASSLRNKVIDPEAVIIGEVGLGGEVRSVPRAESRVREAIQMGFKTCVLPKRNLKSISEEWRKKIRLVGVDLVDEAIEHLLND